MCIWLHGGLECWSVGVLEGWSVGSGGDWGVNPFIFLAFLFAFIRVIRGLSPLQKITARESRGYTRTTDHQVQIANPPASLCQLIDLVNSWGLTS
jgi:hypothetical protein